MTGWGVGRVFDLSKSTGGEGWRWMGKKRFAKRYRGWGKAWQRLVLKISRRVGAVDGLRSLTKPARTIWAFPCLVELHERVNAFGYLEMVWLLFCSEASLREGILIPAADLMRYESTITGTGTPYLLPYTKNNMS